MANGRAAEAEAGDERALSILVVEDHADAREALVALLEIWGHRVVESPNGTHALQLATDTTLDVALLDLDLPDMDGCVLAGHLLEGTSPPVLVALTGYSRASDRERAFDAGFAAHLVKPIEARQLQAVLREHSRPA